MRAASSCEFPPPSGCGVPPQVRSSPAYAFSDQQSPNRYPQALAPYSPTPAFPFSSRHSVTCSQPSRVPRDRRLEIPVQLARLDPVVDRPPAHPEAPRQLRLRNASIQIVLQQHPRLPSVHPRAAPSLLASPTAWTAPHRSPISNVCGFRLPRMGNLRLPVTRATSWSLPTPSSLPGRRVVPRRSPMAVDGCAPVRWLLRHGVPCLAMRRTADAALLQRGTVLAPSVPSHAGLFVPATLSKTAGDCGAL